MFFSALPKNLSISPSFFDVLNHCISWAPKVAVGESGQAPEAAGRREGGSAEDEAGYSGATSAKPGKGCP